MGTGHTGKCSDNCHCDISKAFSTIGMERRKAESEESMGGSTDRKYLGAYNATWFSLNGRGGAQTQNKWGTWVLARPLPFYNFRVRLQQAWDILTYKADALYWD